MLTTTTQYNKLSITMTSKPMQTLKDIQNPAQKTDTPMLTLDSLIEAQVAFMQQWLCTQAQPLSMQAWQWFGEQPLSKYISSDDLQHLINDWFLKQPLRELVRRYIRNILHPYLFHSVHENLP